LVGASSIVWKNPLGRSARAAVERVGGLRLRLKHEQQQRTAPATSVGVAEISQGQPALAIRVAGF